MARAGGRSPFAQSFNRAVTPQYVWATVARADRILRVSRRAVREARGLVIGESRRETPMKRQVAALLFAGAFVVAGGAAWAHHSFAMFDQEHPVDMVGVVHEFKFTSPHT